MGANEIQREMNMHGTSPETIGREIKQLEQDVVGWMNGKLSVKQARLNSGMMLEAVSEETGISVKKLEWYEENPEEFTLDESIMVCQLYGVKMDEVSFKSGSNNEKECRVMYPSVRRMLFATGIKTKIANIMLGITDDRAYSDQHIIDDLLDILDDIENEEERVINEISSGIETIKSKNHLNLSLAGR